MRRSARSQKLVKVFETLVDGAGDGPAADGTYSRRARTREDLLRLVGPDATCYGRPINIRESDVPRHLAERWGCA